MELALSKVVLDSVPDAVMVINVEDYTVVDANRALLEALKLTKEEVVGKTCFEVIHGRSVLCAAPDDVCPICEMLKTGKPMTVEHTHYDKDGKAFYVEVSASPIKDKNGKITHAIHIVKDITETKIEQKRQSTILRTALDGFWITDMQGRLLEVNDAYCRMIGYSREELLTMRISDVEAAESLEETAKHIQQIMKRGSDRFETRHKRKDGGTVDLEVSANYMKEDNGRLFVFVRDITERKRMEKDLWLKAELLDAASDMMFLRNFDGATVYVNEAACRMLGYSREELMKMNTRELVTPEYASSIGAQIKELMKKGCLMFESAQICKDGSIMPVEVHACILERNNQKFIQAVIRDITKRKMAEELVQESAKKLKNAERLATIGATAGMVGHDIRNPLQAITNDLYLVKSDISSVPDSEEKKNALESLDEIGKNVLYINKIVTCKTLLNKLILLPKKPAYKA